jgi:ABC-2 type transport system permease protein
MDRLLLYWRFTVMQIKASMEYRLNFFMSLLLQAVGAGVTYLGIWVIFDKFTSINGWSYDQVLFLYSLNTITYGLCSVFVWDPMRRVGRLIQSGEFDSILIRPIDPFFHMLARTVSYNFLVPSTIGLVVLVVSMRNLGLVFSLATLFSFLCFLIGAFLIQCSIFIIGGSLSFWFVNSMSVVDTFIYSIRRFIDYPISLYSRIIQFILTFLIPYAFVNFYPAVLFLGKKNESLFHPALQYGTPLVGLMMISLSFFLWRQGLKRYQSTGS